ncbi:acyl-ACP--UDP-N-acetylglucosamine O-acyltransferase [Acetobacteraceae bacterium]|nr:acyl-ACP--UDP-N-acetylglucosamine O-acyltransferase [Acetobacteraceae bacterium]
MEVHPTAIIEKGAILGNGVHIGPWCHIDSNVIIGDNVRLHSSVSISGRTKIGNGVEVYPFATIGLAPQDLKYQGEDSECLIGDNTIIREGVTIHRGTAFGGGTTSVGKNCLVMVNAHIAHDCCIGNNVIIVNNVVIGGHVCIEDNARIMGAAAIHQFVRIGRGAMVGGKTGIERDLIPYGTAMGNRARLVGLNWVGLKRSGVQHDELQVMRQALRVLYPRNGAIDGSLPQRIIRARELFGKEPKVLEILNFMENPSKRGLTIAQIFENGDG